MSALTFLFLVLCVASEQRRNLRILYDALGTLADAVGAELNQVQNFHKLSLVSSVYREKSFRFFQSPDSLMPCSLVCQFLVKILILLSCYSGEISRYIYATFNHEVAATVQL